MKTPRHCRDSFHAATAARAKYPLPSGVYKLREVRHHLKRYADTLAAIAAHQRKEPDAPSGLFGSCTNEDAAVWLKRLPEIIASAFGYDVMPAIRALAGDGVPADKVAGCLHRAQGKVDVLVAQCDMTRGWVAQSISEEYRLMKNHDSMLEQLIKRAMTIIDEALRTAEAEALVI